MWRKTLALLVLLMPLVARMVVAGDVVHQRSPITGRYIVRLADDLQASPAAIAAQMARAHHVKVTHVYSAVLNGFAFRGSGQAALAISRDPRVRFVEEDSLMRLTTSQAPVGQGLDRIDQRLSIDNTYTYFGTGAGSLIFILDSGVNAVSELAGRITETRSFGGADPADYVGHGTAVASLAAGSVHGVAKQASIASYKVTTGTSSTFATSNLIAALNAVSSHHQGNPSERAVVNLSLLSTETSYQSALWTAVQNLAQQGVTVITVVGDTIPGAQPYPCTIQPAANAGAATNGIIAVSASTLGDSLYSYNHPTWGWSTSGTGTCVEIFAPSAGLASDRFGGETMFTGVSASAPFVSGVIALLQERHASSDPVFLEGMLKANGSSGVLKGLPANTKNLLLYSLPSVPLTIPTTVAAFGTVNASISGVPGATYQWNVTNGTVIAGQGTTSATVRATCYSGYTPKMYVEAVVTNGSGASSGFGTVQIQQSTEWVTGSTSINAGESATIYSYLTGIGPWTLYWDDGFTQTVSSSPAVRTVTPETTTTYRVSWFTDGGGCYGTTNGEATVTVNE